MRVRVTRDSFRSDEQWREWQKDCRAEQNATIALRNAKRQERFAMLLKHDASLVGLVIVIPREYVALRWKKKEFAHLLAAA